MPMTMEEFKEINSRVNELVSQDIKSGDLARSTATKYLKDLLSSSKCEKDVITLERMLIGEYQRVADYDKAEPLLIRHANQKDKSVMSWISLAGFYLNYKVDLPKATDAAKKAVELARQDKHMLRHALQTYARVATKLKDSELLEKLIQEIIEYKPIPGIQDIDYEMDFMLEIPEGAISRSVYDAYKHICEKHGRWRVADGPAVFKSWDKM